MNAFTVPSDAPRWQRWFAYSALARIVIFALAMAGSAFLLLSASRLAGISERDLTPSGRILARFAIQVAATVLAYLFLTRVIERRWPAELSPRRALPATLAGLALGFGLMSLAVLLLWVAGGYRVTGTETAIDWWTPLLAGGFGAAISEEIMMRGVVFRITEEGLGTGWALGVSALFFGGGHVMNRGATIPGMLAIAVEAGLLFGVLYHVTRSLWPCIGLHAGWNFAQGTIWGVPVSGTVSPTFLHAQRLGPDWLTGGTWGMEASVLGPLVCLVPTLLLLRHALNDGTFVPRMARGYAAAAGAAQRNALR